ncbi:hypothetical protein ACH5RR_041751 [Cinchona calisaya]|uniref:Uncharacterized protein n=1 Tax=Cinchona calisaya TaxID=153742 RepID=A0ABD2XUF8_9GENT
MERKDAAGAARRETATDVAPAATTILNYQGFITVSHEREKHSIATEWTAISVIEITESSDVAATISQRKNATATAEQSQNAAVGIDTVAAPRSSIDDHLDPPLMTTVQNLAIFDASEAISSTLIQCNPSAISSTVIQCNPSVQLSNATSPLVL